MSALHETYKDRGFAVLGVPCNQFGAQEPGTNEEILAFARDRFGAAFPMFAKVDVNGDGACDLYRLLRAAAPADDGSTEIPWNFTKFLVDGEGTVVRRYAPTVTPEEIDADVAALLSR